MVSLKRTAPEIMDMRCGSECKKFLCIMFNENIKKGHSLVMCTLKFSVNTDDKGNEALIQYRIMHLSTEMGLPIIVHGWAFWYTGFQKQRNVRGREERERECVCVCVCVCARERALSEGTVLYREYRVAQKSLDTGDNTLNNTDRHLTLPHSANAVYY